MCWHLLKKVRMADNLKVFFLGSGSIAIPSLAALNENQHIELVGVGTQPDKKAGRGNRMTPTPVGQFADSVGLNPWKIENINNPETVSSLRDLKPDFILVIAFGQLLKEDILNLPAIECVNVHASILPAYRGASPITTSILNGDAETGISIMKMEKGLDTGPVYEIFKVTISGDDNSDTLQSRLADTAAAEIASSLRKIAEGLQPLPQDHNIATHCRKISKSDAHLDWNESATTLRNKIHAYFPWPGAYFFIETGKGPKRLTVVSADNCEEKTEAAPGTVIDGGKNRWLIACGGKSVLEILKVKPEGKKLMSSADFLRGSRIAVGMNLNKN